MAQAQTSRGAVLLRTAADADVTVRIEAIARGVDSGKPNFWLGLASDYAEECVGA